MPRNKCPSEINTRVIRINVGDYLLLTKLSHKLSKTMAEALHLVITEQAKRQAIVVPRIQIPMPTFRVRSQPTIAVNGNKAVAFVVKPKGGVISD